MDSQSCLEPPAQSFSLIWISKLLDFSTSPSMDEDQDANNNITELTVDEADTAINDAIERIERSMQDKIFHCRTPFEFWRKAHPTLLATIYLCH